MPPRAINPSRLYLPNGTGSMGDPGCILPSVEARSVIRSPPNLTLLPRHHEALSGRDLDEALLCRRAAVVLHDHAHRVAVGGDDHTELRLIDAEVEHRAVLVGALDGDSPVRVLELVDDDAPRERELRGLSGGDRDLL